MDWLIGFAKFFGFIGRFQKSLQGKKTYIVNLLQVIGALGGVLTALAVGASAVGDFVQAVILFADGTADFDKTRSSIELLVKQHAVIFGAVAAAWYVLLDALQNMTKYAAARRSEKKRDLMLSGLKAQGTLPPVPTNPENDGK